MFSLHNNFAPKSALTTIALVSALLSGCAGAPLAAVKVKTLAHPTVTVEAGGTLNVRHTAVQLAPDPDPALVRHVSAVSAFPYEIELTGQVPAVNVAGKATQAADVAFDATGTIAAIAYNTAGEDFGGAVQIVDLSNPAAPKILNQIDFPGMDINCVTIQNGTLYFGGGADPDVWTFRSVVGKLDLAKPDATAIMNSLRGLQSYTATGIAVDAKGVYVGVGAKDGGIEVLNTDLATTSFVACADVRAVASSANGPVALSGTTDAPGVTAGKIFSVSDLASAVSLPDFDSPYAKASLEIESDGLQVLGLSASGLSIRANGKSVFSLPNPSNDDTQATNGASADGDLVFAANGQYGFRVLHVLDRTASGDNFAALVGHHAIEGTGPNGEPASANFLRYKAGTLAVAAGAAGLNVYHLVETVTLPPVADPVATPVADPVATPVADPAATPTALMPT